MGGALPWGSPNCWCHRRSPQGARSGVHLGHLRGGRGGEERAGRLSDNIRAPHDSEPRLPPLGRAVRKVARPAASTHTDGPEAGPPSTSPLPPTYPHTTKAEAKRPGHFAKKEAPLGPSWLLFPSRGTVPEQRSPSATSALDRGRKKARKSH